LLSTSRWEADPESIPRAWDELIRAGPDRLEEQIVAMGWLSREEAEELCRRRPSDVPLSSFLLREGAISPEQLAELLGPQPFYFCGACRRRFQVAGAPAGAQYRCPRCRTPLFPQEGEEILAAEDLEEPSRGLPEDVRRAAQDPENHYSRYVRTEPIGRGGMGMVWKAYDLELKRYVAVKFLDGAGSKTVERFFREAKVAARLEHPRIARVYDAGSWRGSPFLVMQLIEGRTLPLDLPLAEALNILRQAAEAIQFAHERGVVHRDLKPENVMLTRQNEVVVLDFGLAREIQAGDSLSATAGVMGTPPFMSPEQIRGENHLVDARSDVYSLGATLYAALTGRPPFEGGSFAEIYSQVAEKEPVKPSRHRPEIPWEVDTIVLKAMEKDRSRRYPSARELMMDIDRFLRGDPIAARPSGFLYRTKKRIAKQPALFISLSLAALAALLAATFTLGSRLERRGLLVRLLEEGESKLSLQDFQGAHEALVKASEIDPGRAGPSLQRAKASLLRQRMERERLAAREAERHAVEPLLRRLRDAQWAIRPTNLKTAIATMLQDAQRLAELHPGWGSAWLASGWAKILTVLYGGDAGLKTEALSDLTKAIEITRVSDPSLHLEARFARGRAYANLAQYHSRLFGSYSSTGPTRWFKRMASDPVSGTLISSALKDLEACKEMRPAEGRIFGEAVMAVLKGDFVGAAAILEANLDTGSIEELMLLVRCRGIGKGDWSGLRDVEFVAERTRRPDAFALAGQLHSAAGNHARAEEWFSEAVRFGGDASAWLLRGICRQRQGSFREAVDDYTRSLEIDPKLEVACVNRADCYLRLKEHDRAREDLARALNLNPYSTVVFNVCGSIYRELGALSEALNCYARSLELEPNQTEARFDRSQVFIAQRNFAGAEKDLTAALTLDPSLDRAYINRSWVRAQLGNLEGALSDLDEAIRLEPRREEGYLGRSSVLQDLARRKPGQARELLRAAQKDLQKVLEMAAADSTRRGEAQKRIEELRRALQALGEY
jgi:tetratricopeptide (TPR) repeat protein